MDRNTDKQQYDQVDPGKGQRYSLPFQLLLSKVIQRINKNRLLKEADSDLLARPTLSHQINQSSRMPCRLNIGEAHVKVKSFSKCLTQPGQKYSQGKIPYCRMLPSMQKKTHFSKDKQAYQQISLQCSSHRLQQIPKAEVTGRVLTQKCQKIGQLSQHLKYLQKPFVGKEVRKVSTKKDQVDHKRQKARKKLILESISGSYQKMTGQGSKFDPWETRIDDGIDY